MILLRPILTFCPPTRRTEASLRSTLSAPAWARTAARGAVAVAAVAALAACSPGGQGSPASPGQGGTVRVVASTNVYGDLARAVGGDRVTVTSIVSATSQDPHSYEATTHDRLAVSKASLVIENGGGYDPYMDPLVREADLGPDSVITAVETAGLAAGASAGRPAFNEHVWYDVSAMKKVTDAIAARLGALDPAGRDAYAGRARDVDGRLSGLESTLAALKSSAAGKSAVMTEAVPLYLLQAAGLRDATPTAYSSAVEEEQDVPPAALRATLDLVSSRSVALLAYNPQTESPQTQQLRAAAEAAKVPVVDFTETVPEGEDYLGWMSQNVAALKKALA
ncbi:ABC transporter substrate-binding protein [Sinomonas atrocyanea]|uniref:ABC transporter substrate-binding protein n=1 Tax=Sinomonas atrocyanea TaxID=37927 RepID=A0A127A2V6_9MICC|nr:ABC transporter substrate-binding protein [Sinomonas atrocyanea]